MRPRVHLRYMVVLLLLVTHACRLRYEELTFDGQNDASGATATVGGSEPLDVGGTSSDSGAPPVAAGGAAGAIAGGGVSAIQGGDPSSLAGALGAGAATDCAAAEELIGNTSPSAPPPISCAAPGALICDDFEGGQLPYWTVWLGPPAFGSLQGCVVHGGSRALFVQPNAPNQTQIMQPLAATVGSGSLFLRSFVYLPGGQALPDWTVLYEVWDSPTSASDKISLDLHGDGTIRTNNSTAGGARVESLSTGPITLPTDRWACLELEIVIDKINGAMRIYIDDTQAAATVAPLRTRGNEPFSTVIQGANVATGSLQMYWDDFVAATERVGCQ
jgi:hypothetical protein